MFVKAYKSKLFKKIIGELYGHITNLRGHSTSYIREKWEKELGVEIMPDEWEIIIGTQITTTNSQKWRDFSWKNIVRYFITPKLKSRQTGQLPECWRECGHCPADHTHVFWGCTVLDSFWEGVQCIVKKVLGFDINFTCVSFYLGNIDQKLSKSDKYLLKIFMTASKKAITKRWLSKEPPTINQWMTIVNDIHCMERLTFNLRLQKRKG